jgi:hypothetical protein
VRPGDEVQQEQPSAEERVTDECRQHHAKQHRRRGYERRARLRRLRAALGPRRYRCHPRSRRILRTLTGQT